MAHRKRTKFSRFRGSHTHGYGSKKKHRGAGNRGGVGRAGTGKRADANKPKFWSNTYFGKHGFKRKNTINLKVINMELLERDLEKLKSKKSKGGIEINLKEHGYDKLLGKGKPSQAYTITVDYASENAIKKVEVAKGKVIVATKSLKEAAEKQPKKQKPKEEAKEPEEAEEA